MHEADYQSCQISRLCDLIQIYWNGIFEIVFKLEYIHVIATLPSLHQFHRFTISCSSIARLSMAGISSMVGGVLW
jgi:hypothetical protein